MIDFALLNRQKEFADPTTVRLSKHFLLSDFMSNHSVITRGYANDFLPTEDRIENGMALCEHALEPILAMHGPLSVSYGYISPAMSRLIVGYQDPDKPSHHRWDLGAAADICVHSWVNHDPDDDTLRTAPIALAHDLQDLPYSRLITYSESPYLCMAVSAREIASGLHRKAFYENRWMGEQGEKPSYRQYSTVAAKNRAFSLLRKEGLPHGWRGNGYPTYHGGGRRQFHHVRVSKYTMLSDWLFNLQSVANGIPNMPNMRNRQLLETFYAVGDVYDAILDATGAARMSIIGGYVAPTHPYFTKANDWRTGTATFSVVPPEGMAPEMVIAGLATLDLPNVTAAIDGHILDITVTP